MADIYRIERTRDYTVMGRFHLWDRNLSMKAKGLLSYILSTPEKWKLSTEGLAYYMKDGIDAVRSTLKELEHNGYINRKRTRDEKGRLSNTLFSVYEKPDMNPNYTPPAPDPSDTPPPSDPDGNQPYDVPPYMDNPYMENPDVDYPPVDEPPVVVPSVENPTQINNNRPNIDKPKKKRERNNTANTNQSNQCHITPEGDLIGEPDIDLIYETLKARIEYPSIVTFYNKDELDNLVDIMVEMFSCQSPTLEIAKVKHPIKLVRKRLWSIDSIRMKDIVDTLEKVSTEPTNVKSYIMTVLFNAPSTHALRDGPRIRNWLG